MIRHLHRDYHSAYCGLDAATILMTWDAAAADCPACATGLVTANAQKAAAEEEGRRAAEADDAARAERGRAMIKQAEEARLAEGARGRA